jgi:hypothetical protein
MLHLRIADTLSNITNLVDMGKRPCDACTTLHSVQLRQQHCNMMPCTWDVLTLFCLRKKIVMMISTLAISTSHAVLSRGPAAAATAASAEQPH